MKSRVATQLAKAHIAVVIPCYKVEGQIRRVIAGIPEYVETIVAVNDASPDQTGEILAELATQNIGRMVVATHEKNQGVGGAIITGYKEAVKLGARIIVTMAGDDQMDPAIMPAFVLPIITGKAEYVKGNRFRYLSDANSMPAMRRIGNLGLSFLMRMASGYWDLMDPANGYVAISSAAVQAMNLDVLEKRYLYESSMLVQLYSYRARVAQVAMTARYGDEKSSLSIGKISFQLSLAMTKWWFKRILRTYFWDNFTLVSVFLLFGSLLVGLGSVFGIYQWIRSASSNEPATAGTVMLAALPLILGFEFLMNALVMDTQNVPAKPPAFLDQSLPEEQE